MSELSKTNLHLQRHLFPALEEEFGILSEKERQVVRILELIEIRPFLSGLEWAGNGRPPASRYALAKAFIAKAVWNIPTTKGLIDRIKSAPSLRRLCGWDSVAQVPDESTFSRAFSIFALRDLPSNIHKLLIEQHLAEHLCGHVSRDSTAIKGREKPQKKKAKPPPSKTRGRPPKGDIRPQKKRRRLECQPSRSLKKNLQELPKKCDVGTKKNSKSNLERWIGFKLHLDVVDGDIPVSGILTSASLHDSQVAIPLAQMTATRITSLYDLMDAAYDAKEIHAFSRRLGHVPIIDSKPGRGKEKQPMDPPQKQRYKQRSSAERVNSNLKDNYGGNHVRVQGPKKVTCHLMFGIVALTATQLFKIL